MLLQLPPELLTSVCAVLPNSDIKTLRQTCSALSKRVPLRLTRVFLSPNPLNIKVFRAVADHPHLRLGVCEIVYDDARLRTSWLTSHLDDDDAPAEAAVAADQTPFERYRQRTAGRAPAPPSPADRRAHAERAAQHWFRTTCRRDGDDAALLPWAQCWPVYAALARRQLRVVAAGADERALAYGLARFPQPRRVVVTPAAHGVVPHAPLYQTPMIRALPPGGFCYPLPRGWPCVAGASAASTLPWRAAADGERGPRRPRPRLRGMLKQLAEEVAVRRPPALVVPELVVDVHGLNTGLNPHLFAQPGDDYAHFATILSQPGFRRLDLPLMLGGLVAERWACLVGGCFRALLAKARDLAHFRLAGDADDGGDDAAVVVPPGSTRHCPLARILPVSRWRRLRHFGLYRVPVQTEDVLAVLAALPESVRSVELSFLLFVEGEGASYRRLLEEMKARLRWGARRVEDRPQVRIGLPVRGDEQPGRGLWLEKEVSAFLYGHGRNPFPSGACRAEYGMGIIMDEFEPEYEQPYVDT
ncbi:hypothetical protein CCM_09448 [Cordyceps militaris CM01]|uniref:Cyclin-like F-box n=1 Tax=Cordyceps militaris (strain CM01) TaxID=983644 RepID=G3JUB9_CORMM|nr:uncharacterized protein CCM_09448 [Cordyceps militaris CM01]EGX87826.1 hypothetical protein CCM_09448 [Cordyceps militaris CM01]